MATRESAQISSNVWHFDNLGLRFMKETILCFLSFQLLDVNFIRQSHSGDVFLVFGRHVH